MSQEHQQAISIVYTQFLKADEARGWNEFDEDLFYLECLDDDQLHREADVALFEHRKNVKNAPKDKVFMTSIFGVKVNAIIDVVESCLETYKNTGHMTEKNRYILQHFLTFINIRLLGPF